METTTPVSIESAAEALMAPVESEATENESPKAEVAEVEEEEVEQESEPESGIPTCYNWTRIRDSLREETQWIKNESDSFLQKCLALLESAGRPLVLFRPTAKRSHLKHRLQPMLG